MKKGHVDQIRESTTNGRTDGRTGVLFCVSQGQIEVDKVLLSLRRRSCEHSIELVDRKKVFQPFCAVAACEKVIILDI